MENKPLVKQGWLRVLIFIIPYLMMTVLFSTLVMLVAHIIDPSVKTDADSTSALMAGHLWIVALVNTLAAVTTTWLFRKYIDKKSFESLGFGWQGYENHAWTGFFSGVSMLGIGTLLLVVTGYLKFRGFDINLETIVINIAVMAFVALSEELVVRGYLLNNLMQSMNKWVALVLSAVVFASMHLSNPDIGILPFIEIFIGGIMLGINYIYTRNLWFGIFLHFSWNFLQGPVLGYGVSGLKISSVMQQTMQGPDLLTGGVFGFEGSVLAMVLNIVLILILVLVYRRKLAE